MCQQVCLLQRFCLVVMDQGLVQVQHKRVGSHRRGFDIRHILQIIFCITFLATIWFWCLPVAHIFVAVQIRVFRLVCVYHIFIRRNVVDVHLDAQRSYNYVGWLLLRQIVQDMILGWAKEVVWLLRDCRKIANFLQAKSLFICRHFYSTTFKFLFAVQPLLTVAVSVCWRFVLYRFRSQRAGLI